MFFPNETKIWIPSTFFVAPSVSTKTWGKVYISSDLCKNVMMVCLKKVMVDSVFTNYFLLVTKYRINTRRSVTKKNESNSVPVFELTSPAHQLLHLALKSPITIVQNGDVSSTFDNVKKNFLQ